jgi:bifunctional non-homologous end joining protein LigD
MPPKVRARFIEPMLLLRTEALPDDAERWEYQLKLDGYRAIAFKTGGHIHLRSRNDNDFSVRYSGIVKGLASLPDETVIDGEVVAFDDEGRPSFNVLQNHGSSHVPLVYFVFDLMILAGQEVMSRPLAARRELLERTVLPRLRDPIRYAAPLEAPLPVLIESVRIQGLEGLVAKRLDSRYETGLRTGAWQKMRVNRGQEFVIGGYTVGGSTFDALVFGYYDERQTDLRRPDAQRLHAGRTPTVVHEVPRPGDRAVPLREPARSEERPVGCRPHRGEDEGLPLVESGPRRSNRLPRVDRDHHLRHTTFVALRDDRPAEQVGRE